VLAIHELPASQPIEVIEVIGGQADADQAEPPRLTDQTDTTHKHKELVP